MSARGLKVTLLGVSKAFAEDFVLKGIDAEFRPGEFVAIVGRSGCGKSTLLRMISGIEQPTEGGIELNNHNPSAHENDVRLVFQDARLLPWRSVLENVALATETNDREAARKSLRDVGLTFHERAWPETLSGGQRQRAALARALVTRPRLLLLDEPLGALDALTRLDMQSLVERLWIDRRFTAVLVTHDVEEAVALADRVLIIDDGRIAIDHAVNLPRQRDRSSPEFLAIKSRILGHLRPTGRLVEFSSHT